MTHEFEAEAFATFENEDFAVFEGIDEEREECRIRDTHGTICLVKGLIKEDPDHIAVFGIEDGEETAKFAFWKPYDEIFKIVAELEKGGEA